MEDQEADNPEQNPTAHENRPAAQGNNQDALKPRDPANAVQGPADNQKLNQGQKRILSYEEAEEEQLIEFKRIKENHRHFDDSGDPSELTEIHAFMRKFNNQFTKETAQEIYRFYTDYADNVLPSFLERKYAIDSCQDPEQRAFLIDKLSPLGVKIERQFAPLKNMTLTSLVPGLKESGEMFAKVFLAATLFNFNFGYMNYEQFVNDMLEQWNELKTNGPGELTFGNIKIFSQLYPFLEYINDNIDEKSHEFITEAIHKEMDDNTRRSFFYAAAIANYKSAGKIKSAVHDAVNHQRAKENKFHNMLLFENFETQPLSADSWAELTDLFFSLLDFKNKDINKAKLVDNMIAFKWSKLKIIRILENQGVDVSLDKAYTYLLFSVALKMSSERDSLDLQQQEFQRRNAQLAAQEALIIGQPLLKDNKMLKYHLIRAISTTHQTHTSNLKNEATMWTDKSFFDVNNDVELLYRVVSTFEDLQPIERKFKNKPPEYKQYFKYINDVVIKYDKAVNEDQFGTGVYPPGPRYCDYTCDTCIPFQFLPPNAGAAAPIGNADAPNAEAAAPIADAAENNGIGVKRIKTEAPDGTAHIKNEIEHPEDNAQPPGVPNGGVNNPEAPVPPNAAAPNNNAAAPNNSAAAPNNDAAAPDNDAAAPNNNAAAPNNIVSAPNNIVAVKDEPPEDHD